MDFQLFNALECYAFEAGGQVVPLTESEYRGTYELLLGFIEKDWNHSELGDHVKCALARSIESVRCGNPFTPPPVLIYFF